MKCVFCQVDPHDNDEVLCLIPAEEGEDWACMPCAKKNGLYCEKHDQIHTRFLVPPGEVGNHACVPCIEEGVRANSSQAGEFETRIRKVLSEEELAPLDEWVATARSITGDPDDARTLLRAIITSAARCGLSPEIVVADIEARKIVQHLLPSHYFL